MDETHQLRTGDLVDLMRAPASAPESDDDLIGTTLNDTYIVEARLGEGGMGRVYLARHTRIAQKRVAVKVLHGEYASSHQVRARFQREAEAAAAITHPNVLTVFDVDVTPRGLPYLVCEYLAGIDLAEHLRQVGRLELGAALAVTRQLCRGLGAAHERGIVHRDLKPPNVFLVGDFSKGAPERIYAKILDFGLSRFEAVQGPGDLTKTGLIMGTPSYMAPEQAQGKRVDQRADVYGLGAILYRCLTGRAPFNEASPRATIAAVQSSAPARPRALAPAIPPHVELVIERAMAKDAAQRYPDMAAFERALDDLPGRGGDALARASAGEPAELRTTRAPHPLDLGRDAHAARPRLILLALSGVLLAICGAASAVRGVELATGHTFDAVELRLLLLALVGSLLTPALLWFLRVRQNIWESTSRVLMALTALRTAVVGGVAVYGLLLLAFNVLDGFVVRLLALPELRPVAVEWAGWSLIVPSVALTSAVTLGLRKKLGRMAPGWRRIVALGLVTALGAGLAVLLLYVGWQWRDRSLAALVSHPL